MSKSVTIDGIEYVQRAAPGTLRIVILQRGWIVVGRVRQDGTTVIVEDASVIRVWGTTRGLGQIAADGPTSSTILDACGTVRVHELAVVAQMDCVAAKWA